MLKRRSRFKQSCCRQRCSRYLLLTPAWWFELQLACAYRKNSALALSLKLALTMVRPCGFRAVAPAYTLDTFCRGASNRRIRCPAKDTLFHNDFDGEMFAGSALYSRGRFSSCFPAASKAIGCVVVDLLDDFIAAPPDFLLWSATHTRLSALEVCWMCLTCGDLGSCTHAWVACWSHSTR